MKPRFIIFILLLNVTPLFAQQIGMEYVDKADIKAWITDSDEFYFGTYHFGESEAETELILFKADDVIYGQIKSGDWNEDATDWVWYYENLSNIRIEENRFYSDQTNGTFILYKNEIKCLKINDSWSDNVEVGTYELGRKTGKVYGYFYGEYSEVSMQVLSISDLNSLDKNELQIMRNEIFARYGYRFKEGGKMAQHFSTKRWYKAQHDSVRQFFTELEKQNIALIIEVEKTLE